MNALFFSLKNILSSKRNFWPMMPAKSLLRGSVMSSGLNPFYWIAKLMVMILFFYLSSFSRMMIWTLALRWLSSTTFLVLAFSSSLNFWLSFLVASISYSLCFFCSYLRLSSSMDSWWTWFLREVISEVSWVLILGSLGVDWWWRMLLESDLVRLKNAELVEVFYGGCFALRRVLGLGFYWYCVRICFFL